MAASLTLNQTEPMSELNTTPLIDVMLVLLIMFIITIPVAAHNMAVDLPSPTPPIDVPMNDDKNRLTITPADQILWNGQEVTQGQLAAILAKSKAIMPEPELQYAPDALASYDMSAQVLSTVKASGVTKFGFVDNEKYRTFGK
ncbi:biopolymer transporter ExbD [Altererythrobacter sp. ZODW24]|uniref:ExbD/TolR family protein n=1 Tax=Altererythrobacter sp. ZODW24 TaxID=2185142 RepID=UPI000DF82AD4|nr:biopolymer transporter ExbD [Altererythrobacter sp. ZODW24]